jgi:hypothetical protein
MTKKGSVEKKFLYVAVRGIFPKTFRAVPLAADGLRCSSWRSFTDRPNNFRVDGAMHEISAPVSGKAFAWIETPSGVDNVTSMVSSSSNSHSVPVTNSDPTPML